MNFFRKAILRALLPSANQAIDAANGRTSWAISLLKDNNERLASAQRELDRMDGLMTDVLEQRDTCLNHLVALVALDEHDHWTTVFDADTRLPGEISEYLTELVARA